MGRHCLVVDLCHSTPFSKQYFEEKQFLTQLFVRVLLILPLDVENMTYGILLINLPLLYLSRPSHFTVYVFSPAPPRSTRIGGRGSGSGYHSRVRLRP